MKAVNKTLFKLLALFLYRAMYTYNTTAKSSLIGIKN